jgi:hypothetical protein
MSSSKSLLKTSRLLHLYLGVFTTPALIFFAFTGFVQTFSLHEATRGSDYKPPQILVNLGQLHKKQTLVVPVRKPQPPATDRPATLMSAPAASEASAPSTATGRPGRVDGMDASSEKRAPEKAAAAVDPAAATAKKKNLWPMKIFFAIVSISLLLSTFTGLYMSYKYVRNRKLVTVCLVAGLIIPVLLTFL